MVTFNNLGILWLDIGNEVNRLPKTAVDVSADKSYYEWSPTVGKTISASVIIRFLLFFNPRGLLPGWGLFQTQLTKTIWWWRVFPSLLTAPPVDSTHHWGWTIWITSRLFRQTIEYSRNRIPVWQYQSKLNSESLIDSKTFETVNTD